MAGTLPAEYAKLDTLNYLDVHDNYLTGQLPSAWFTKGAFSRDTFLEVRTVGAQGPPDWLDTVQLRSDINAGMRPSLCHLPAEAPVRAVRVMGLPACVHA